MNRAPSGIEETVPFLAFSRRGTAGHRFVQLCIQDRRESDLIIRNLTPQQARRLAVKLLTDAEMGDA